MSACCDQAPADSFEALQARQVGPARFSRHGTTPERSSPATTRRTEASPKRGHSTAWSWARGVPRVRRR